MDRRFLPQSVLDIFSLPLIHLADFTLWWNLNTPTIHNTQSLQLEMSRRWFYSRPDNHGDLWRKGFLDRRLLLRVDKLAARLTSMSKWCIHDKRGRDWPPHFLWPFRLMFNQCLHREVCTGTRRSHEVVFEVARVVAASCSDTHTHLFFLLFLLLLDEKMILTDWADIEGVFPMWAAHSLCLILTFIQLTWFLLTYWWLAGENNDCIVSLTLFWSFMLVWQHSPQTYWLGSTSRLALALEGVIRFRFRSENLMIFYQTAHSMWAEMIYIPTECD